MYSRYSIAKSKKVKEEKACTYSKKNECTSMFGLYHPLEVGKRQFKASEDM